MLVQCPVKRQLYLSSVGFNVLQSNIYDWTMQAALDLNAEGNWDSEWMFVVRKYLTKYYISHFSS